MIFLCNFQPFTENSYHYAAKYECKTVNTGKNVEYNTGDYHHFFNMTYTGDDISEELKQLFAYIRNTIPENVPDDSDFIKKIDERVRFIKNSEDMQEEFSMINLYENEIFTDGKAEGIAQGIAQGRQEGIKEGRQEGIKEGIKEKAVSVALKLLKRNFSIEDAADCSGLTLDEVSALNKSLLQSV